jgi:hypothetical protein
MKNAWKGKEAALSPATPGMGRKEKTSEANYVVKQV